MCSVPSIVPINRSPFRLDLSLRQEVLSSSDTVPDECLDLGNSPSSGLASTQRGDVERIYLGTSNGPYHSP